MNIGNLEIKLLADVSQLTSDMNAAKGTVGDAMRDMESAVGLVKTAFVALAGVGSVAAFGSMISSAIEYTGSLKDMSTQTGASALALDQFRTIGATSETAIDSVTGAMGKLSKNMINGSADSKGAGVALQALGLDFNTIKAMKPEDQMLAIAGSLNQFSDGADKSAAAQALFGKEGAKLLPFLKDLGASAEEVTAKLTDQEKALRDTQAAMADAFGDNLTTIRHEADGWKRDLADGMTPALFTASQAFLDVSRESGGFKDQIKEMSRDGTFKDWTQGAITGLTYLMDVFSGLGTVVKSTGLVIGGVMASVGEKVTSVFTAINQAANGEFSAAMETMAASTRQQDVITKELTASLDAAWSEQTLGSKLRERMTDLNKTGFAMDDVGTKTLDVKGKLDELEASRQKEKEAIKAQEAATKAHNAELKKQEDQYNKLIGSMDEKILGMEQAIETGGKLSDADKIENKLLSDLANSNIILTDKQLDTALGKINLLRETEALTEAMKREKKETEDATKAYADLIDKLQKSTDSTVAQIEKQRESNNTIFMSKEQLAALSIQKDLDTAATWDQKAAWAEQNWLGADLVQQYKDQATNLRTLAGLKEQGIHVQAARDAAVEWDKTTRSIGDGLSSNLIRSVKDGKDIWLNMRDYMVGVILDGMLKNALSSVFSSALSGFDTMLGGIVSSAMSKIAGAQVTNTATSTIGSAASTTGGTSLLGNAGTAIANSSAGQTVGSALGVGAGGFTGTGLTGALGIGASAGTGVTTSAVVGGNGAMVVGTDLGLLGSSGAAATGTAAGSSIGAEAALGGGPIAVAAVMAAYIFNEMFTSSGVSYSEVSNGNTLAYNGAIGGIPIAGGHDQSNSIYNPGAGAVVQYDHLRDNTGRDSYAVYVDGVLAGSVYSLDDVNGLLANPTGNVPPGYASGGDFSGGLRIVGENGPELEATGPSRIFDAQTTASMLRSGGANESELVAEMRLLRRAIEQDAQNTAKTAKLLQRLSPNGDALQTRAIA